MGQLSHEQAGSDEPPRDEGAGGDFGNAGMGAASALEKMKSQHERRHQRHHGSNAPWSSAMTTPDTNDRLEPPCADDGNSASASGRGTDTAFTALIKHRVPPPEPLPGSDAVDEKR